MRGRNTPEPFSAKLGFRYGCVNDSIQRAQANEGRRNKFLYAARLIFGER